jgi:hypothetical protein
LIIKCTQVRARGPALKRLIAHIENADDNEEVVALRGHFADILDARTDAKQFGREYAAVHWIISPARFATDKRAPVAAANKTKRPKSPLGSTSKAASTTARTCSSVSSCRRGEDVMATALVPSFISAKICAGNWRRCLVAEAFSAALRSFKILFIDDGSSSLGSRSRQSTMFWASSRPSFRPANSWSFVT